MSILSKAVGGILEAQGQAAENSDWHNMVMTMSCHESQSTPEDNAMFKPDPMNTASQSRYQNFRPLFAAVCSLRPSLRFFSKCDQSPHC